VLRLEPVLLPERAPLELRLRARQALGEAAERLAWDEANPSCRGDWRAWSFPMLPEAQRQKSDQPWVGFQDELHRVQDDHARRTLVAMG